MRNNFADAFFEKAKSDSLLTMCVADISPAGAMNEFRQMFPNRFINTGVAEQSMIGIAAGLAMAGLKPFAYTIATFALFRPFEFIRVDVCYQDLPVTIVGMGGGVVYSTLGGTHQAQEDINVARTLPNLEVYSPCDPFETKMITYHRCEFAKGPAYMRIGKAGEKNLGSQEDFQLGFPRVLKSGSRICVVGHGSIMSKALKAVQDAKIDNDEVCIQSFHQLKPVNLSAISEIIAKFEHVIVFEECSPFNGLFSDFLSVKESNLGGARLHQMSLADTFFHFYGTHDELLAKHGLIEARLTDLLDTI